MGIDYGGKRVGIALSDDLGKMAFPYTVLTNSDSLVDQVVAIAEKEGVREIVVGESRNFKGEFNPIMQDIVSFAKLLKNRAKLPLYFEKEFLTSREATHIQGETKEIDASAAALILRSFIDKHI